MTNRHVEQYRAEWASKTGKLPSEIYVPKVLLDDVIVVVERLDGFATFEGKLLLEGFGSVDSRGELSVVEDKNGEPHVVPTRNVRRV